MNILGISAGYHDAALTVINDTGNIVFAGHAERYSKIKNDPHIHADLVTEALGYGPVSHIAYYERPWMKQLRRLYSGEGIEWDRLTVGQVLRQELKGRLPGTPVTAYNHHLSHAAGGFQTSPFESATVVVVDAVGEWDTASIWSAEYRNGHAHYKRLWSQQYPHSIGLFYSAVTARLGLRPMDEEYIVMGMAAYGSTQPTAIMRSGLVESVDDIRFKQNLHAGLDDNYFNGLPDADLAASAQAVAEELIYSIMSRAKELGSSSNLVYSGGVALNCLANRNLGNYFENIWIMPCPGDSGSSLGAAALAYGQRLNWKNAYLGCEIPGKYPTDAILDRLLSDRICGVASGRAEFGPRALGNRSLLADPRGPDIKDLVNRIKRRQEFRPFAPVILAELADEYFDMPKGWITADYMQTVARCRRPDSYPAVVHHDGTSRVQTVPANGSGIRLLLEKWLTLTGCPMLLNTSLNIRGEPIVNDRADADRFEQLYGVRVCS
jgi:carbamoyltransferase